MSMTRASVRFVAAVMALLVSMTTATAVEPMGTAFTYQGHLVTGGIPVTDVCSFEFSLWDAASGGSKIGPTLPVNTAVSDG